MHLEAYVALYKHGMQWRCYPLPDDTGDTPARTVEVIFKQVEKE